MRFTLLDGIGWTGGEGVFLWWSYRLDITTQAFCCFDIDRWVGGKKGGRRAGWLAGHLRNGDGCVRRAEMIRSE